MRAIPVITGGTVWIPLGVDPRRLLCAMHRAGYHLNKDHRGRLIAHRLH